MDNLSYIDRILCENWESPLWNRKKRVIYKKEPKKFRKLEKYASEHRKLVNLKRENDKKEIQKLVENHVDPNYIEPFSENLIKIDDLTIQQTLKFSYDMVNKCKNQRSGGTMIRSPWGKIYNHIQGKIAEVIVHKLASDSGLELKPIDFNVYPIGKWDDGDVVTLDNSLNINVKSGLDNHQLLLLTKSDYNSDGSYKHHYENGPQRQVFSYVRLKIDRENILDKLKSMDQSEFIGWFLKKYKMITYDTHFCNENLLKEVIHKRNIISKGVKLNGTLMDADNYYLYLFNMNTNITSLDQPPFPQ